MTEKEPLLGGEPAQPLWKQILAKPFSCVQRPNATPEVSFEDIDESDEDELLDLPYPPQITSNKSMEEKLTQLRSLMRDHGIAVYLVPSQDEHQSEYTALADKRRDFISGFTGSAGIAIVTLDDAELMSGEAALSTDGRYFLQAKKQLDPKWWKLLKQGQIGYPLWQEWALEKAAASKFSHVVSCDPSLISLSIGQFFNSTSRYRGVTFKPHFSNLIDQIWTDKPTRSTNQVYQYSLKFSGEDANSKISRVRKELKALDATHLVITALDDIGWLFNLRSDDDIPFSPFFFSYAIVSQEKVSLYAVREKLLNVRAYLQTIGTLELKEYDQFYHDLSQLKPTVQSPNIRLVFPEKSTCNFALWSSVPNSIAKQTIIFESVVAELKLVKNKTELLNAKIAQYKDSLSFIILAAWLEHRLLVKKEEVTEYQAAQKQYTIRARMPNFKGLSYETISSSGPNAAIIHYAPTEEDSAPIDPTKPYLLDSGCHFLEGTTDITRTYQFSSEGVTAELKKLYTLVLKGHLDVAVAKFPSGDSSTGTILDAYARQPLWNEGLDFNHGTGHGVGSFGNVHESPLYILTTSGGANSKDYFQKGGILTDEPGYYVDGHFGIRIESELEIVDGGVGKARNGEDFLGFAYLTKVPFCTKLIDPKYLTSQDKSWINAFHNNIRDEFGPRLLRMGEKRAYAWLLKETVPVH